MSDLKERPIPYITSMVQAIRAGKKTQTRRVVSDRYLPLIREILRVNGRWVSETLDYEATCPYGRPGDLLWVRETWAKKPCVCREACNCPEFLYRADFALDAPRDSMPRWKSPRFMPRTASRITQRVLEVRVERLQDITENDALSEGMEFCDGYYPGGVYKVTSTLHRWPTAVQAFRALWDGINAARGYGWDVNPWVWRIRAKTIEGLIYER